MVLTAVEQPRVEAQPQVPQRAFLVALGQQYLRHRLTVPAQLRGDALDLDDLHHLLGDGVDLFRGQLFVGVHQPPAQAAQPLAVPVREVVLRGRRAQGACAGEAPGADLPGAVR